jgi:hypothetical protein
MADPNRNNSNTKGSLDRKGDRKKLSKSRNPMSRKFATTRPAINQERKNCQDR